MDREEELLFYVQNRLSEQDKQAFENRLSEDPQLAAEVAVLKVAKTAFAEEDEEAHNLHDGWAELETRMDATPAVAANANRPIRLGLLQVAAVAVISVMTWQFVAVPQFVQDPARYETVSSESSGYVLQVVFRPAATFAEAAVFLARFGGSISDGPGAVGVYRVRFEDATQLENAMMAAKTNAELFEFVAAE